MKAEGPEVAAPTATATPAADAKSRALANLLPAKALAMLAEKEGVEGKKDDEADAAGDKGDTPTTTTTTTGETGDESIDLTLTVGEGETAGDDVEQADEDVEKLAPDQLKKKLANKNQENAKIRKRAQEAERLRDEFKQQAEKLNQELEAARSQKTKGSGGRLSDVTDSTVLTNLEKDAENVLDILKTLASDPEANASYKSLTDGQEYTVDGTFLSWALATQKDVQARRDQLKDLSTAEAEASKVIKLMEKTPAFKSSLEAVKSLDYFTQRPLLEADAALGRLAREGGYVLVKKDKAAGAKSPAVPAAERPIAAAHPRTEVTGTMPPVTRMQEGASADVSAAKSRAMTTGRPEDIRASIAAKTKKLQRPAS